jgi:hypothetical protein
MRRRRLVRGLAWVGVAVCLVVLALGLTTRLLGTGQVVTRTPYGTIRKGMTQKEVQAVLGGPPGFYPDKTGLVAGGCIVCITLPKPDEHEEQWWFGLDVISVYFDKGSGRVTRVESDLPEPPLPPGPFDCLRAWLGW